MSAEVSTDRQILAPGSSTVSLTDREWEVARLIGMGYPHKKVAARLGISVGGVSAHVSNIASRIPGEGKPNMKIAVFMLTNRTT